MYSLSFSFFLALITCIYFRYFYLLVIQSALFLFLPLFLSLLLHLLFPFVCIPFRLWNFTFSYVHHSFLSFIFYLFFIPVSQSSLLCFPYSLLPFPFFSFSFSRPLFRLLIYYRTLTFPLQSLFRHFLSLSYSFNCMSCFLSLPPYFPFCDGLFLALSLFNCAGYPGDRHRPVDSVTNFNSNIIYQRVFSPTMTYISMTFYLYIDNVSDISDLNSSLSVSSFTDANYSGDKNTHEKNGIHQI